MHLEWLGFLGTLLLAASLAGCFYLAVASYAVRRLIRRPLPQAAASPPVSLLKPLCGADAGLYENLRSFCLQNYPGFQLVFGVADPADPAIPVVRRLMAEFPKIDMELAAGGTADAGNLKVANLISMLPLARHDVLAISDSDMRVPPNYIGAVTAPLADPGVGLVTCLYRGISSGGFWSDLAAMHVNHGFLPMAAVGEALGAGGGAFGASLALKRATLDAAGGFARLKDYLADDHVLGQAVVGLGRRVLLSPLLVDDMVDEAGLGGLFRHELRWANTVRLLAPWGYAGSVIGHPLALALLALLLGAPPLWAVSGLILAFLVRWATIRLDERALVLARVPAYMIPVRDLLSFVVYTASFFTRSVAWRDRRFRLGRDGRLRPEGDRPA
jgi:ceramide glucosyltransferase